MGTIVRYFEQFNQGEVVVPEAPVQFRIAQVLDAATNATVTNMINVLKASPEHQARVTLLQGQARLAGPYKQAKVILNDISSFEQMVALSDWLGRVKIQKPHTFFFSSKDDYVPVKANKYKCVSANMMHVMLGSTRGDHKAPKYEDWAANDPWQDERQKVFACPLEALEIVRQPDYSAATMLKGNCFEMAVIETDWRYGSVYACVEEKGQSKNSPKKLKSAGLNACSLVKGLADESDPKATESDIALSIHFEDYAPEGYADDLNTEVTPGGIIEAAKQAIEQQTDEKIKRAMEILTIAKLGVPRTPMLKRYIGERLLEIGKA